MNKQRYERRAGDALENKGGGELVEGVPIPAELPAGATQLDAYKEYEKKANYESARLSAKQDASKIEDRDNRGADAIEGGKIKPRIPIHEVDALAEEMAGRFARDPLRVTSTLDGDSLTVTIVTIHGAGKVSADVDDWSKAGVEKALKVIEDKLTGKIPSSASDPSTKLTEAIKEVVAETGA